MGDVAQILGVNGGSQQPPPPAHSLPSKAEAQQIAAEKDMWTLAGEKRPKIPTASLPPMVPQTIRTQEAGPDTIKVGTKWISTKKAARPWVWAPFSSSSRTDGTLFYHWVRANVEYPDYPFARFDIHLDPVVYSDDEYARWLTSKEWTKAETDQLMDFARRFELRWAVIFDRWLDYYDMQTSRRIEDLQHRYYQVAAILNQRRLSQQAAAEAQIADAQANNSTDPAMTEELLVDAAAARSLAVGDPTTQPLIHHIGTGSSNKVFDLQYERERRAYQESLWSRSKEDEVKEAKLRTELKEIETQLRKIKRKGGAPGAAASSAPASRSVTPVPDSTAVNSAFAPPTPVPGVPYLQSARLGFPPTGGPAGINKALLQRLQVLLEEMKVPNPPIATKRACDLYDKVRKDALQLLIYQKNVLQKEGMLQNRRSKLEKLTGMATHASTEEGILGIPPRKVAPAPAPPKKKASASGSATPTSSGGATTPASHKSKKKSDNPDTEKKSSGKRKRKADSKSPTAAGAAGKSAGGSKNPGTAKSGPGKVAAKAAGAAATKAAPASGKATAMAAVAVKAAAKASGASTPGASTGSTAGGTAAPSAVPAQQTQKAASTSEGKTAKKRPRKT
eukprot:scaffold1211_cov169-Amphora_coffeaeformis.AAC.24